jgi:hypothetical protein
MTTNELWIEYDRLCDLAEAAAQTDPLASYNWVARLIEARQKAVASEFVDMIDKSRTMGDIYPYVSADVADSLIERGGRNE